jgi:hypothetical protein
MSGRMTVQLGELTSDLRTAIADRLVALGILHESERHLV